MNRVELLKALKGQGYTGKADLKEIETFITENNLKFVDKADKPLDVKAVFASEKAIVVETPEPETKAAEVDNEADAIEQKSAEERIKAARAADAANHKELTGKTVGVVSKARDFARKQYERKIKQGTAVFNDPDSAEAFSALCRVTWAQSTGKTYDHEGEDREILVKHGILQKTTSTLVNTTAGVLVDPMFVNQVLYNTEPYGLAVQIANVQNFKKTDNWQIKRKTGIVTMSHIGEGQAISSGDPTFDYVGLTPKKAGVLTDVTNELLDDSAVSYADQWAQSIKEARDIRVDQDYFIGDGTSTYGGHRGLASGLVSGAYINGSGNSWSAITDSDVTKLAGYVENVKLDRCAYVCSRQFYAQRMIPIQRALGGVTLAEGVSGSGAKPVQNGMGVPNATFMGWPVYFSQVLPTASASASKFLYFGDFVAGSMVGLHCDLRLDVSRDYGFNTDKTYMRAITRFAVNICGDGRTPASTYGPIVCLQTT